MAERRDRFFVLRRIPFGETSWVMHGFGREGGRFPLLAKGARKKGERGILSGFHTLVVRFRPGKGEGMGLFLGADLVRGRHRLAGCPPGAASGLAMLEGIYRFLPPEDPHPGLFDDLEEGLDRLEAEEDPLLLMAAWQGRLLARLGHGWRMDRCVVCGGDGSHPWFSRQRGGSVCASCRPLDREGPLPPWMRRHMESLEWPREDGVISRDEVERLFGLTCFMLACRTGRALSSWKGLAPSAVPDPWSKGSNEGEM